MYVGIFILSIRIMFHLTLIVFLRRIFYSDCNCKNMIRFTKLFLRNMFDIRSSWIVRASTWPLPALTRLLLSTTIIQVRGRQPVAIVVDSVPAVSQSVRVASFPAVRIELRDCRQTQPDPSFKIIHQRGVWYFLKC